MSSCHHCAAVGYCSEVCCAQAQTRYHWLECGQVQHLLRVRMPGVGLPPHSLIRLHSLFVCVCMRACMRVCVHACVPACVCMHGTHLCAYECVAMTSRFSCLQVNWMVWLGLRILLASCPIELRGITVLLFSSTAHDSWIILFL